MSNLFWLDDEQWAAIEPFTPKNQPGARRKDDRRVMSGVFHVLRTGCRWQDCPRAYGPPTTIYNRFNRWSRKRFWTGMLEALASAGPATAAAIDSTYVKAQRAAYGGKVGPRHRPSGPRAAGTRRRSMHSSMSALRHRERWPLSGA